VINNNNNLNKSVLEGNASRGRGWYILDKLVAHAEFVSKYVKTEHNLTKPCKNRERNKK
jgi:hypothetical protein